MAAPIPAARVTPPGKKLGEGYGILITIASDPDIDFWEKGVTPPGVDSGDVNDNSTGHNKTWRTKSPRKLIEMTNLTLTVGYATSTYAQVIAVCGVPTTITVHFTDGSSLAFYGVLKSFIPGESNDSGPPEAAVTIVPTNQDPNTCAEEDPVYTQPTGTAIFC